MSVAPSCLVCPNTTNRAMKQLEHSGKKYWAHLTCVHYVPELDTEDRENMDDIVGMQHHLFFVGYSMAMDMGLTGVDDIPKARWRLKCQVCHEDPVAEGREAAVAPFPPSGAPIQCRSHSCRIAFHPLCARR